MQTLGGALIYMQHSPAECAAQVATPFNADRSPPPLKCDMKNGRMKGVVQRRAKGEAFFFMFERNVIKRKKTWSN